MEVIFRPNENLCLLAALWGLANGEQQDLMTNGGEADVKEVFKNSMGKGKDDSLKNGAGADDVRKFLKRVVKVNKARGVKVGFKWRKISGIIGGVVGPFNVESLRTRVLAREDRYVFFGKAAAIGTQMGYLYGNPFGHRVRHIGFLYGILSGFTNRYLRIGTYESVLTKAE